MKNYNPIIIAMGVESRFGEPDSETKNDAESLLKRAGIKQRDGHIAKFNCDGSGVTFCEADGTVIAAPKTFAEGSPALYFLVHGSNGCLYTVVPGGDLIEAAGLYKTASDLSKFVKKPFEYINIVACNLLEKSFKPNPPMDANGETNIIMPLARSFNNERVKPIIAAYRKLVFVDKDGSKTAGQGNKATQAADSKDYKAVYRFAGNSWARCKNFHNKNKVLAGNQRQFENLAAEWNELGPLEGNN